MSSLHHTFRGVRWPWRPSGRHFPDALWSRLPAVLRHTGLAALAVVLAGLALDSATVVIAGVLALILATWGSIVTGNRTF